MPNCIACGAELEPPVRTPHTVCMKSLYRIAGQDYCRHHIIRAAVADGVIAEVKPAADRWRWCIGKRPRLSMTGPTGADPAYAITLRAVGILG